MFKSKSKIALVSTTLIAMLALVGCGQTAAPTTTPAPSSNSTSIDKKTISAAGSTALQPLVKLAADDFMAQNSGVQVNLSGGGSMTGLNNVASGSIEIGNSDVVSPDELKSAGLVDHQVCVAPFLLIVNKDVTVDSLTKEQAADIFTGKVTNWKDVGGKDMKVSIIGRAASSGTRLNIEKIVMDGKKMTDAAAAQDSTGNLLTGVAQTPGAIGYIDAAYLKDTVKALKFNGVAYSPETVINGQYPIYSYEHMYTKGEPTGTVKLFLDYILSTEFQEKNVEKAGFIPVSKMKK
ncbi:phosphate ABC transporter substrate-binding protein [Desulfosporosinus meridiei]|uniref:Phosphate-binding protein n=1 Tax=Desulfosporosinus meridiei (strain ATCC BAA-275 / DSM 13257 / KCTC 12902 / NCIMB 13706 / S10) TaxID=768704 RepID=J7IZC8_DESMD|nr:phosphate ABC transporter substrate-binding protein [Desulfosporosinus meridiei]AFQ44413.1 phosphate ABC transporter substrate-binding protein, PhoT family [Desulfosporosinus meridiei DSM 13257]